MTVYVVSRQVDGRNLIAGVYRNRADACKDAESTIDQITQGEYDSYSVNAIEHDTDISVFTGEDWRCIVYPFELQ